MCCFSEERIDSDDWSFHWAVPALAWIASGVAGAIAAVALFRRKRWSMELLAVVAASLVVLDIAMNLLGHSKYAYEMIDPIQVVLSALLAVASFVAYVAFSRLLRASFPLASAQPRGRIAGAQWRHRADETSRAGPKTPT